MAFVNIGVGGLRRGRGKGTSGFQRPCCMPPNLLLMASVSSSRSALRVYFSNRCAFRMTMNLKPNLRTLTARRLLFQ